MMMKQFTLGTLFFTATVLAFAGDLSTEQNTTQPAPLFDRMDEDHDGFISLQEANKLPVLKEKFSEYDMDQNDKLDKGEYQEFVADQK
jgi:Ca2+-binding EF-hand superfamily protein